MSTRKRSPRTALGSLSGNSRPRHLPPPQRARALRAHRRSEGGASSSSASSSQVPTQEAVIGQGNGARAERSLRAVRSEPKAVEAVAAVHAACRQAGRAADP